VKRSLLFLIVCIVALPLALFALQDGGLRVEITGVNATALPTAVINVNVYDAIGQPITGLTAAEFALTGTLANVGSIVDVQNISDDNLPFATVLVLDVSSSMVGSVLETSPVTLAKLAARTFVENIRDGDPVALVTFSSQVNVILPYTTDKATLLSAIDNIAFGGETALYQAGYDAVRLAAEAPVSRRVVILLSDGAEFGGSSQVERDAAEIEALTRGVPVYTIGLGFGTDRSYLESLATSTNARFYESPTPEELNGIYSELASLLRSQYVITLSVPVPLDGTEYDFGIRATAPQGTGEAFASLRAPVPVPLIRLPDLPTTPITALTVITADVTADQEVSAVSFALGDQPAITIAAAPYTFTIDPAVLPPGDLPLTVAATDADGDIGIASATVPIGALAPIVVFDIDPTGLGVIAAPVTVSFTVSGQTPVSEVTLAIDGGEAVALTEPFSFTIDPVTLSPGAHLALLTIRNAGGGEAVAPITLAIDAIPPTVTISALQEGQAITEVTTFSAFATGQGTITGLSASAAGVPLPIDSAGFIAIDPAVLAPGAAAVMVTASSDNGTSGSAALNVLIGALPPQITVGGLTAGQTIGADTIVTVTSVSQTPISAIAADIDEDGALAVDLATGTLTIPVLGFAPGDRVLTIDVSNTGGETSTVSIPFVIDPAPAATATAIIDAQLTATQAVIDATASQVSFQATGTQEGIKIAATQVAFEATGTKIAVEATTAQVALQATGTQGALDGAATQGAIDAGATQSAIGTATQGAADAASTQSAFDAQSTATQGAFDAQATQVSVQATATQGAIDAGATQSAIGTATQGAADAASTQGAIDAQATQAVVQATATQGAIDAQATQAAVAATATQIVIEASATQAAIVAATASQTAADSASTQSAIEAQSTQAAVEAAATQAAVDQAATDIAAQQFTATMQAATDIAGQSATATLQAATDAAAQQFTATAQAATDAAILAATSDTAATQAAQATATRDQQRADMQANAQLATRDALATANAAARAIGQATQDARATRVVQETAAVDRALTATAQAANETATAAVQATMTFNADLVITVRAATQTEQAIRDAGATRAALDMTATAQAALFATATQTAQEALFATATQVIIEATATAAAQATDDAALDAAQNLILQTATQIIVDATATAAIDATATQAALDRLAMTATQVIRDATATAASVLQAQLADQTATQIAQGLATETASAARDSTATTSARALAATGTADAAAVSRAAIIAADNAATAAALTATADALAATAAQVSLEGSATQLVRDATAAANASATQVAANATTSAQQTAIATPDSEAIAQAATDTNASPTPQGTLTAVSTDSPPSGGDAIPLILVVVAIVVILLLLFFALRGNRDRRP